MSEANFFRQGAVPISAIVITKDEEANIGRCLSSLYWVAEVIVVDCGSTDRTRELAMGFANVKLIDHEWEGYSANKRVAVSYTRHKWVLWLDADEEVTYDLQHEILSLPGNQFSLFDAFEVCRKTYFLGSPSSTLYPSRTARLFNKDKVDFNNKILHEGLHITDKKRLGRLQFSLNHYSFRSLDQFFNKMNTYGRYGGLELLRKRKLMGKWRLVLSPIFTFFKYYFLNGGILDRKHGLMMSLGSSYANYIKYSHYYYLLQEDRRSLLRERLKGKAIIVSRTDNIGDVILTLPLVVLIKKHIPGTKVIFLGKRYTESIIDAFPSVDSFIAVEDLMEGKKKLSATGAEAILFAFPDRLISKLAFEASIPLRVGTAHRWFHLVYGNRNIWFTRKNSDLHEAQLNLNLLHPLGIHDGLSLPAMGRMYQLEPKENLPSDLNELLLDSRFKLICHPKSRGSAREWPLSHYALLCSRLPADKFLILITGTKEEGDLIRNSGFWGKAPSHVKDLTGSMSLAQFLSFISKADGLLACSTGPLHMASALGKPALGLYPPMHPIHAGRWAPLGPKARYITLRKNCNDCRKGGPCACIEAIEVNEVQAIIEKW
jgi:ADP-heptose:LPS heptosyltransferase